MSDTVRTQADAPAPRDIQDRPAGPDERSVSDLLRHLSEQTATLVRQEMELAKAELSVKGKRMGMGAGMFGGAGIVGACAAGALTAFLVLVFSLFLPEWAAALIVGAILAAVAYVLVRQGKQRLADVGKPVPEQTIETVKEDVEWAKTRASSARR
jgi:MFS family permease